MKKLLVIIALSLLLSGNAYAAVDNSLWRFNSNHYILFVDQKCKYHHSTIRDLRTEIAILDNLKNNKWSPAVCNFKDYGNYVELKFSQKTKYRHEGPDVNEWYYVKLLRDKARGSHAKNGLNVFKGIIEKNTSTNVRGIKIKLEHPLLRAELDKRNSKTVVKKPKTAAKKPETSKPFAKSKLINQIKNAPNPDSKNRIVYYFFAYTSQNDLYYGWANPITMPNGRIKEFYGTAKSVNYKTGIYNENCNITSKQTKTSAPFQGNFDMECPNNKRQNIIGSWTQDQFDEPGLGSGFNKNGDQVSVFFALQKEILINSINSFNFDGVQEVKKPSPKKVVKKEPPKKQITKAPEIDESLLTIGSGSGFYINNKGYALTNNHVVDVCKQMVAVVDGREILFRVLNTDKTNDVAIIKTDQRSPNFIKINEEGAKLGEDIIAVGYPLSDKLSDSVKITRGIVSSLSGIDNNSGQIQIDAALQPGNSGGPVINESGELIGIASAGLNKLLMAKEAKYIPENVNFAVSSSIVTNILKNKKVSYSTPSFFSGSYSNTELATLGDKVTLQLFCRNTRTAYNKLKRSKQYSHILIDLD